MHYSSPEASGSGRAACSRLNSVHHSPQMFIDLFRSLRVRKGSLLPPPLCQEQTASPPDVRMGSALPAIPLDCLGLRPLRPVSCISSIAFPDPRLSAFIRGYILWPNHNRLPKPQLLQPRQLRLRIAHHQPDHPVSINILRRQRPYLLHRHRFNYRFALFHVVILPTMLANVVQHVELRFSSFKRSRVTLYQSAFSGLQIGG